MNIEVRTSQIVDGHPITTRQIEVLRTVASEGSKNAAARKLGISPPVVHKYIASMEEAIGLPLISSTPSGTVLTAEGSQIVRVADQSDLRCDFSRKFTVACTPVTEDLMMSTLSSLRMDVDLVISDDAVNLRMMKEGLADMAVIDDPMYLFDAEEFEWSEIGNMGMVHVDNGSSYIRYRFGAQRIAYMYLDSLDREYSIDAETFSLSELISSNRSFFVDEFLLSKKGIRMKSAVDPGMLKHVITAIYPSETREITKIVRHLLSRQIR